MQPFKSSSTRYTSSCAAYCLLLTVVCGGCGPSTESRPVEASRSAIPASVHEVPRAVSRPEPGQPVPVKGILPRFVDVALEVGIQFTFHDDAVPGRYFLPEVMGGGVAWIDVDHDGWLDLFLANGRSLDPSAASANQPTCRLYRNLHGERFSEITAPSGAGITLFGQGCAVGDYDSDGFADLFVSGYGPDVLLRNAGDGTFHDVTAATGVSDPEWSSSTLWVDLDDDQNLDLYVTNYMDVTWENRKVCEYGGRPGYCGPGSYSGIQDRAYLSRGDGTFQESSERLGLRAENGKGLAVVAADFDDDLIPEVYVANDMTANFMFSRRTAPGNPPTDTTLYREVATEAGCAVSGSGLNEASMGISLADFDGDGRIDIYLSHYYHTKNTLYRNLGNLLFDDASYYSRVAATSHESLGFGSAPFDYDRDGDLDLFIANGHVLGPEQQPNAMRPQLLRNDEGIFADVSLTAGQYFDGLWIGRSVAAGDFDNDGDVDLAISHLNLPFVLLRNDTPTNGRPFIGLKLKTAEGTIPVGGRVVLRTNKRQLTFPVSTGGSYLASADDRLLLFWRETEELKEIDIHWPSGRVDRLDNVPVRLDQYWRVREGKPPRRW